MSLSSPNYAEDGLLTVVIMVYSGSSGKFCTSILHDALQWDLLMFVSTDQRFRFNDYGFYTHIYHLTLSRLETRVVAFYVLSSYIDEFPATIWTNQRRHRSETTVRSVGAHLYPCYSLVRACGKYRKLHCSEGRLRTGGWRDVDYGYVTTFCSTGDTGARG